MRVPIEMPRLGNDVEAGRIGAWLKAAGDHVHRGVPTAEIETDKATVQMDAPGTGVIAEIIHPRSSDVPVGTTIANLETDA